MKRDCGLPTELANLGDMTVAEAQRRASEQGAELFVIGRTGETKVVRIVEVRKAKME